jgi:poly-gamma-glutamate synthesis protein (capsule biosynthesis protein)
VEAGRSAAGSATRRKFLRLVGLELVPLQTERFRLRRTAEADTAWLAATMDRECRALGTRIERGADGALVLRW